MCRLSLMVPSDHDLDHGLLWFRLCLDLEEHSTEFVNHVAKQRDVHSILVLTPLPEVVYFADISQKLEGLIGFPEKIVTS